MCGIFGVFSAFKLEGHCVLQMAECLTHRGPDGYGVFEDEQLAFGAGRLAIIDLSAPAGPLFNPEKRIGVAFNGEIYNYRPLREALLKKGYVFQTKTDTEVLLHAYAEKGLSFLQDLEGMFAFCMYDVDKRQLLLARDRLGEKPLYYCQIGQDFLFASEIKALLLDKRITPEVNQEALPFYLSLGYTPAPMTLFKGIQKLGAGEYLIVNAQGLQKGRYWHAPTEKKGERLPYPEAVQKLRQMLDEHVSSRMVSDVPVGALLSGGVDSSSVVALMKRHTTAPLHSFTVGFDFPKGSYGDEKFNVDMRYARQVVDAIGTEHHAIRIREALLADLLPHLVYQMDEPIAQHSIIQSVFVTALARERGIPVLLSGDAGDELFLGYQHYQSDLELEKILRVPHVVRHRVLIPLLQKFKRFQEFVPKLRADDFTLRYMEWMRFLRFRESACLLNDAPERLHGIVSGVLTPTLKAFDAEAFAERIAYTSLQFWIPEDSNMRMDKMAMMMSIETRAPLEGHRLLDFALSLPLGYKLREGDFKRVFKDAVRDLVPHEVLTRPKWGFIPPTSDWLRTVFRPLVDKYLSQDYVQAAGMVDAGLVCAMVTAHMNKTGYFLKELWAMLVLHLWHALYISSEKTLTNPYTPADIVSQCDVEE